MTRGKHRPNVFNGQSNNGGGGDNDNDNGQSQPKEPTERVRESCTAIAT